MMSMTEPTEFTYYVEPFLIRTLYLEIAFCNMMPMTERDSDLWLSVPIRGNVKTIVHKNANNFISAEQFDLKFYRIS